MGILRAIFVVIENYFAISKPVKNVKMLLIVSEMASVEKRKGVIKLRVPGFKNQLVLIDVFYL